MLRTHHAPLCSMLTSRLTVEHAKSPLASYADHSITLLIVRAVP